MTRKWAAGVGIVLVLLAVGAAAVLARLDRLIAHGVETVGPQLTGTAVGLEGVDVSIFSGKGRLHGLSVANPDGFRTPHAFTLGRIAVALDTGSLGDEVIRIRSIAIDQPQLVAEFEASGRSNLKRILEHVRDVARSTGRSPRQAESEAGPARRMIIEEFHLRGAELRTLAPALGLDKTLTLPDLQLRNLGGRTGATAAEIAHQILRPLIDTAIRSAREEYLRAERAGLEQKAKEKSRGLLDRLIK